MSTLPDTSGRPPKRMRLGTRSCVECRRRKVRCIFPAGRDTCNACALHNVVCSSQQPHFDNPTPSTTPSLPDRYMTNQRLDTLSDQIRCICNAIGLDLQQPGNINADAPIEKTILRHERNPSTRLQFPEKLRIVPASDASGPNQFVPALYVYQDEEAPLLRLFKDSNLLSTSREDAEVTSPIESGSFQRAQDCVQALANLIPVKGDLAFILRLTEPYWSICPVAPTAHNSRQTQSANVPSVQQFIYDSLGSGKPATAAKAALWLAYCVQQLPKGFDTILATQSHDGMRTSAVAGRSKDALLSGLLNGAEVLVSIDADSGGTLEGVESGFLQAYNYITLGRPCKAWSVLRRAINSTVLIGLYRKSLNEPPSTMWQHLWQTERHLSITLGLPYAIASTHPSISKVPEVNTQQKMLYDIGLIVGRIIDRNQNFDQVTYADTQKIHDDLSRLVSIPLGDLLMQPLSSSSSSLADMYHQSTLDIYHLQTQKYLHLPYYFDSTRTSQQEHSESKAHVIRTCKKIIQSYQNFRTVNDQTLLLVCDLMDFQTFSAAMVLVIHEFRHKNLITSGQEDHHWNLIHELTKTLTRITAVRDCPVARQGADVLAYFSTLYHAQGSPPEAREVVIPYFGKIRVTIAGNAEESQASPNLVDEIQMNVDISSYGSFSTAVGFQTGAELASDWMNSIDWQGDFDWNWTSALPFD